MTRRYALLGFFALAGVAFADDALPKAETILDRYVQVTGGKAAYEKRKNEIATGTMEVAAAGIKGTVTRYAAAPDKSYVTTELEGVGKVEQGTIGGMAWDKNPMLGPRVKSGEEKAQALREGLFNGPLHWRDLYSKVETVGVETIDGEECYKVVQTPSEGKPETTYYSKKTGFAVKTTTVAASPMGDIPVEQTISDYKNFDGIMMATKMVQKAAGQELMFTIQSVKVNTEIPADRFDPPADIKALAEKK